MKDKVVREQVDVAIERISKKIGDNITEGLYGGAPDCEIRDQRSVPKFFGPSLAEQIDAIKEYLGIEFQRTPPSRFKAVKKTDKEEE